MPPLGQTITVVNKSGKIVSSSKQLVNVFKEAKAAYREKKAEISASRDAEWEAKKAQRRAQKLIEDDNVSRASSRKSGHPHRAKSHKHGDRPVAARHYTDSFYANDEEGGQRRRSHPKHSTIEEEMEYPIRTRELVRRHTDGQALTPASPGRRHSEPHNSRSARSSIDMDLAYGDLPPPVPQRRIEDEEELRGKMSKLTMLLDEANCVQHSATAMVEHLQKNPDALAAVALTLAEVSNLASKMAPGALMALKGSFPAAMALLASPQFLIAAGLGVGVTVVMLGGYKIIKKIQANKALENGHAMPATPTTPLEMQELDDVDLSRIELWRRGIADVEAQSQGTTVDGEFITPGAHGRLVKEGVLDDTKSVKSSKTKKSHHHRRGSQADDASSKAGSSVSRRRAKTVDGKTKVKRPSPLKMLFQGHP